MTGLQRLLIENTGVGGVLPSDLYNLIELQSLELSRGSFTRPLSESVSQFVNLGLVRLGNNSFTGTIPTGFESLPFLGKSKRGRVGKVVAIIIY